MICNKNKFIFIHVPKTGGTSIEMTFAPKLDITKTNYKIFTGWSAKSKIWMQHASIKQIYNLYKGDLSGYFKFGFVRNPWGRAVSDYRWMKNDLALKSLLKDEKIKDLSLICKKKIAEEAKNLDLSLKDYLLHRKNFKKILTGSSDREWKGDHIIPQSNFLYDNKGSCLADFIGRFENLQEDFNVVCDKVGIPRQQLPHHNRTEHKHYVEYYDDETRQIVAEKYAKDIEYFNYEFGE